MARKATEQVTTIGIDIGKNTFHLIGFDDRSGSYLAVKGRGGSRLLLRAQRSKITRKQTIDY